MKPDSIPVSPPPELRAEFEVAAHAADRLAQADRGLHFVIDEALGRVRVEIHDLEGRLLDNISGARALDIAAGGSLD